MESTGTGAVGEQSREEPRNGGPADEAPALQQANDLLTMGRFDEALALCDGVLAEQPLDGLAHEARGMALHGLGRFGEAVFAFDNFLDLAGTPYLRSWALHCKACSLRRAGRSGEALELANRAIELFDDIAPFWIAKGNCLRDLKEFEGALACYERSATLGEAMGWFNHGLVHEDLGQPYDARESYRRCIRAAPDDVELQQRMRDRIRPLTDAIDRLLTTVRKPS